MQILFETACSGTPRVAVVCCLHGDEHYGVTVFNHLKRNLDKYPGLMIILANEPAIAENTRFIEQDLNRSFPGVAGATNEAGIAHEILLALTGVDHVLDIHTTTSDVSMVPIVTMLNEKTRQGINATDATEAVLVASSLGANAMISHVSGGVSLEYGDVYAARAETLKETTEVIERLLGGLERPSIKRNVFSVTGVIPKTTKIPNNANNFTYISEIDAFPILLHEKSYKNIHALAASKKETMYI